MAESYGLTVSTAPNDGLIAGDFPLEEIQVTIKSAQGELARGTVLGKISKELDDVVPDEGNTGDGEVESVTLGAKAKLGDYVLECKEVPVDSKTVPTTGTAGTNTGNGTCTGVSAGSKVKAGTYELTCTSKSPGTASMPTTGTAGTNTGNGTCTGVSAGEDAMAGTYLLRCTAAVENAGQFEVLNPLGERLSDAVVGVAYTSDQINFTLNDGSTDFAVGDIFTIACTITNKGTFQVKDPDDNLLPDAVVGEGYTSDQINFTLNDGSTDFAVGDTFTIAATEVKNSGNFTVQDPDGYALPDAQVGVAYVHSQINFTISDGDTDFAVGDKFTIPVVAPSTIYYVKSLAASVDGSQEIDAILNREVDATSAAVVCKAYVTGDFNQNKLTFGTGHTASSLKAAAKEKNIFFHDVKTIP